MADKIPQFRRKTSSGYQILQEGNPFQVPDNKLQENITVTPSNDRQVLHATPPYNGVHEIIVKSVSESETALKKENIRAGVTIFDITGEYGGGGSDLYNGDVTLTTNPQTFNPVGHDGFSSIKVTANISAQGTTSSPYVIPYASSYNKNYVTISKPSSSLGMSQAVIKLHSDLEQYIKKDIKILGITGTYEGSSSVLGTKTVDPSTSSTTYNASSDSLDGYSSFTVNAIHTETKSVTPGASPQTVTPSTGKYLASVTVAGDSYLVANNIRKDISIFGVTGTYEGSTPILGEKTVSPDTTTKTYYASDDGLNGYSSFTVTGTHEGDTYILYDHGRWDSDYNNAGINKGSIETYEVSSNSFSLSSHTPGMAYFINPVSIPSNTYQYLHVFGNTSTSTTTPYPKVAVSNTISGLSSATWLDVNDAYCPINSSWTEVYIGFKIENVSVHMGKRLEVYSMTFQK